MKKFLKYKNEIILGGAAIIMLGALVYAFIWGVGFIAESVGSAITGSNGQKAGINFDLQGAKRLNLKGLAQ